ncbi:MAG: hypothetical protein MZW92_55785 [Comamonadaceae bacterium]|nr:hypothetical protein [Comamonadaceae bacterium]
MHDGSLFPTSIGANPQLSVYGLATTLASGLAARARRAQRRPRLTRRCWRGCSSSPRWAACSLALLWGWVALDAQGTPGWAVARCGCFIVGRLRAGAGAGVRCCCAWRMATTRRRAPRLRQLLRAWWGEVQAGAARVLLAPALPQPALARPPACRRAGPATACCWCTASSATAGVWNALAATSDARGRAFRRGQPGAGVQAPSTTTSQIIEQAVQRLERCTGVPPVIVAHSMGGLALRRWLAEAGRGRRPPCPSRRHDRYAAPRHLAGALGLEQRIRARCGIDSPG